MLHIWGRISSINVRKVVWTAQELGLTLQRTDAGGRFGIVKERDYLRKNPNALVPMIEDGEVVLWESNVIVRYLCAKYGAPTLAASRASLPPEGARLAWGGRRGGIPRAIFIPSTCPSALPPNNGWTGSKPPSIRRGATPSFSGFAHRPSSARPV